MMFEILGGEVFPLREPWLRPGINSVSLKKGSAEHKALCEGNVHNRGNAKGASDEEKAAMVEAIAIEAIIEPQ